jgi:hypothetical protein
MIERKTASVCSYWNTAMGSISRHARIHFTRPGVDAALQVIDTFVASSREEIRYVLAAMTVMTNDNDLAMDRQIVRTG